jgi:membrane associated rhomboid family serine protease
VTNARKRPAPATTAIITAILIGFVIEVGTGAWRNSAILSYIGALRPIEVLRETGQYWRLLTAMFLHGNGTPAGTLLHLLVNLLPIVQIGTLYEMMFGTRRYLIVYFVSGLAASLTSAVAMNIRGSSVGASGAIFGLLGAFIFSVLRSPRWRHERAARSIVKQIAFLAVANILIGLQIEIVDNAAHIGGLIAGIILGASLPHHEPPPPPSQLVVDVSPRSSALPRDEP